MAGVIGQRAIEILEAEGPTLPIVVLARRLDIPPSRLTRVLDDLFDEGRVTPGGERGTVSLVPQPRGKGRFQRDPAADPARARP